MAIANETQDKREWGGWEGAAIRSLPKLGYMRLYLLQHRKEKKHYRKLAAKETKEPGLVSAGGWVGEAFGRNRYREYKLLRDRGLGRGIKKASCSL